MILSFEYDLGFVLLSLFLKMSIASLVESASGDVRVQMKNRLIPTPKPITKIHKSRSFLRIILKNIGYETLVYKFQSELGTYVTVCVVRQLRSGSEFSKIRHPGMYLVQYYY